jgi:hypothetical protein
MVSAYRDGLDHRRREVRARTEEAVRRGREIRRQRALPPAMRRELVELERDLGQPIRCLDDAARCERQIEEYGWALRAAEDLLANTGRMAPFRRRLRAVLAIAAALLVALLFAAFAPEARALADHCVSQTGAPGPNAAALFSLHERRCVYRHESQCAELCSEEGRCGLRDGDCVAAEDDHCTPTRGCIEEGRCRAVAGRCVARSHNACGRSRACKTHGRCQLDRWRSPASCVALEDRSCAASDRCASEGRCVAVGGECVQRVAKSCAYSDACAFEGRCSNSFDKRCYAASDDDCRHSRACLVLGRCMASVGHCKALADWSCSQSRACQDVGWCRAVEGRCIDLADPPARQAPRDWFGEGCGAPPAFAAGKRTLRLRTFARSCSSAQPTADFYRQELRLALAADPDAGAWRDALFTHDFVADGQPMCALELHALSSSAAVQLRTWLKCRSPRVCPDDSCRLIGTRQSWSRPSGSVQHLAGDDDALNLAGALVDAGNPDIAIQPLDLELTRVAVAAV